LMSEWATQGLLDKNGRLIGKSDEEQLQLLKIGSFSDLDFSTYPGERKKLEKAGINIDVITKAPPEISYNLLEIQENLKPHEILTIDTGGNWVIYNRLNGTRYPADADRREVRVPEEPVFSVPERTYAKPGVRRGRR